MKYSLIKISLCRLSFFLSFFSCFWSTVFDFVFPFSVRRMRCRALRDKGNAFLVKGYGVPYHSVPVAFSSVDDFFFRLKTVLLCGFLQSLSCVYNKKIIIMSLFIMEITVSK